METLCLPASSAPINWDSYSLKFTGKQLVTTRCALYSWMPYCCKWPLKYCNTGCSHVMYTFVPPLFFVSNRKIDSISSVSWTAGFHYHKSGQVYTSYEVRLPSLGCRPCAERLGFLLPCAFFNWQAPKYYPSSLNRKVDDTPSGSIVYRGRVA